MKKIFFKHTGRPGKFPQTTRALGAAEVTTGGWFKRNGNRVAPLDGFLKQSAQLVTGPYACSIPYTPWSKFTEKINGIGYVDIHAGEG